MCEYPYIDFIQRQVKQMKAFGDWTPFIGFDETVKWSKALNFLQSDRSCPRIESAKCSFHWLGTAYVVPLLVEVKRSVDTGEHDDQQVGQGITTMMKAMNATLIYGYIYP